MQNVFNSFRQEDKGMTIIFAVKQTKAESELQKHAKTSNRGNISFPAGAIFAILLILPAPNISVLSEHCLCHLYDKILFSYHLEKMRLSYFYFFLNIYGQY